MRQYELFIDKCKGPAKTIVNNYKFKGNYTTALAHLIRRYTQTHLVEAKLSDELINWKFKSKDNKAKRDSIDVLNHIIGNAAVMEIDTGDRIILPRLTKKITEKLC